MTSDEQGQQETDEAERETDSGDGKIALDRDDEEQDFVDQSKIDFDPDDGLYSGTAVDGNSEIPGPHQDSETGEVDMDEVKQQAEDQSGDESEDEAESDESEDEAESDE